VPQSFGFIVRRGALASGAALVIAVAGAAAAHQAGEQNMANQVLADR
jgi:hypothetical protein